VLLLLLLNVKKNTLCLSYKLNQESQHCAHEYCGAVDCLFRRLVAVIARTTVNFTFVFTSLFAYWLVAFRCRCAFPHVFFFIHTSSHLNMNLHTAVERKLFNTLRLFHTFVAISKRDSTLTELAFQCFSRRSEEKTNSHDERYLQLQRCHDV